MASSSLPAGRLRTLWLGSLLVPGLLLGSCAHGPRGVPVQDLNLEAELATLIHNPSPWEAQVLKDRGAAQEGNAEALFDLALLFSGDVRTGDQRKPLRARYDRARKELASLLKGTEDPAERGRMTFAYLHEHLLTPGGYDIAQGRLSQLLATGRFNCLSATLLYLVLARDMGLDVQAATMRSHAIAQLTLPDGQTLDIETTVPKGFGLVHDQAFFKSLDRNWYKERGLQPGSYQDYLAREILSPLELIATSAYTTDKESLPKADQDRLTEFATLLQPLDALLQRDRLVMLYNHLHHLQQQGSSSELAATLLRVWPGVETIAARHEKNPEIARLLAWLWLIKSHAWVATQRSEAALNFAERALALLPKDHESRPQALQSARAALGLVIQSLLEKELLEPAQSAFARPAFACQTSPDETCHKLAFLLLGRQTRDPWDAKQWDKVVALLVEQRLHALTEDMLANNADNLQGALVNLAIACLESNDRQAAQKSLQRCLKLLPTAPLCQERLGQLEAAGLEFQFSP